MGQFDVPEKTNGQVKLSARQQEVLTHLLKGRAVKEIAQVLQLSPHTVRDYVKIIYKQYDVSSRGELLALWVKS